MPLGERPDTMDEARRRQIITTDTRGRAIFTALALIVPLTLAFLFKRQENRLRALADHGRTATATVTAVSHQGGTNTHYRYAIDGADYTWNVNRKEAPFAPGERFDITYLPEAPSLSRPGAYTQERLQKELDPKLTTYAPIGIFVFCAGAAALCHRNVRRLQKGAPLRTKSLISPEGMGRIIAGLLLAILLGVNLDPEVAKVQAAAFGARPLGLPLGLVVCLATAALFAPYFWVFPHLMRIVMSSVTRGGSLSKGGIMLAVARAEPTLRRSQRIVIGGLVYFVALAGAWIAYASSRGL